ncbi:MAG: SGNH/GDSL hydrolase family protein [Bacillota bacterium]
MERTACLLKQGQVIVFEGDSLTNRAVPPSLDTWPYLRLMHWHRTWADDFAEHLFCWRPDLRLTFHNSAVGGSSCRELLGRFERSVLPHHPDWVILTIGNNDATQDIDAAEFRSALKDYIRRIRDDSDGRAAFVAGFQPIQYSSDQDRLHYQKCASYCEIMAELAGTMNGLFIDAGKGLSEKANELYRQSRFHTIYSDERHLNPMGNLILAGEVLKAFNVI